jgi:hypothetical protein
MISRRSHRRWASRIFKLIKEGVLMQKTEDATTIRVVYDQPKMKEIIDHWHGALLNVRAQHFALKLAFSLKAKCLEAF